MQSELFAQMFVVAGEIIFRSIRLISQQPRTVKIIAELHPVIARHL
jgi:hypothetical protein